MSVSRSLALPLLCWLAVVLAAPLAAGAAQVDYLLVLDGIPGETKLEGLELQGPGGGGQATLLLPAVQKVREAAARMQAAACDGSVIPSMLIEVLPFGGREPVLLIELENVLISSYSIHGSGSALPMESFSLNYTRAEWTDVRTGARTVLECSSGRCVCSP